MIWGIVHLCRSNITGDMIKKLKNCFFKKCQFLHFLLKLKVKNCFLKKQLFSILIISPSIFELEKRTIPQIKALNILFWPYFIHFIARMDIWWAMKPRKCPVFFAPDFMDSHQIWRVWLKKWACHAHFNFKLLKGMAVF